MTSPTYVVVTLTGEPVGVVFAYGRKSECLRDWIMQEKNLNEDDDMIMINNLEEEYDLDGPFQLIQ